MRCDRLSVKLGLKTDNIMFRALHYMQCEQAELSMIRKLKQRVRITLAAKTENRKVSSQSSKLLVHFVFFNLDNLFVNSRAEYSDLQRIKRELALLQKLYNLYNNVIENVNSYYDILWAELDIEKINSELLEFQNK